MCKPDHQHICYANLDVMQVLGCELVRPDTVLRKVKCKQSSCNPQLLAAAACALQCLQLQELWKLSSFVDPSKDLLYAACPDPGNAGLQAMSGCSQQEGGVK